MKVQIQNVQQIYKGFIQLDEATLQFEKFNGTMSRAVRRINVYRGDAVAVLLFDSLRSCCYFVRQFRYPVFTVEPQNAWPLEVVAGSVESNDGLLVTAIREVEEEAGFRITGDQLVAIGRCYPSPGGTSERIFLYAVDVANATRVNDGGGLTAAEEDIQVIELSESQVHRRFINNEFCDAKTLLCLHWYFSRQPNRSEV